MKMVQAEHNVDAEVRNIRSKLPQRRSSSMKNKQIVHREEVQL